MKIPPDFTKALNASPRALATWKDITPIACANWILWITTAKKLETRDRRVKNGCSMLASGKRRVCCFGGKKWLEKTGR